MLRLEGGAYFLLDRHLRRMQESAIYFGFPFDRDLLDAELDGYRQGQRSGSFHARLLLNQNGSVTMIGAALGTIGTLRAGLAQTPVNSSSRWLYHKTTHRGVYEPARAERPDTDETLLFNERGELTEFTIGNLVLKLDGRFYTPPIASGLLPSILRGELLDQHVLSERTLTVDDPSRAEGVWLINSLRGWVPVELFP